jgi:hypothetical protein
MVTCTALLPDLLLLRSADAALGRQHDQRRTKLPGQGGETCRGYFLFAGVAAGFPGPVTNGEGDAVTFGLFCLGFFGSRPLRF